MASRIRWHRDRGASLPVPAPAPLPFSLLYTTVSRQRTLVLDRAQSADSAHSFHLMSLFTTPFSYTPHPTLHLQTLRSHAHSRAAVDPGTMGGSVGEQPQLAPILPIPSGTVSIPSVSSLKRRRNLVKAACSRCRAGKVKVNLLLPSVQSMLYLTCALV